MRILANAIIFAEPKVALGEDPLYEKSRAFSALKLHISHSLVHTC